MKYSFIILSLLVINTLTAQISFDDFHVVEPDDNNFIYYENKKEIPKEKYQGVGLKIYDAPFVINDGLFYGDVDSKSIITFGEVTVHTVHPQKKSDYLFSGYRKYVLVGRGPFETHLQKIMKNLNVSYLAYETDTGFSFLLKINYKKFGDVIKPTYLHLIHQDGKIDKWYFRGAKFVSANEMLKYLLKLMPIKEDVKENKKSYNDVFQTNQTEYKSNLKPPNSMYLGGNYIK